MVMHEKKCDKNLRTEVKTVQKCYEVHEVNTDVRPARKTTTNTAKC